MIPILIGGTGRSGTSILKKLIAAHPAVSSFPGELRVIVDPGGVLDVHRALTDGWSPYAGDASMRRFALLLQQTAGANALGMALATVLQRFGISPPTYSTVGIGNTVGSRYYRRRVRELLDELCGVTNTNIWAGSPPLQVSARMYDTNWTDDARVGMALRRFVVDLFANVPHAMPATHWVEDTPYNLIHVHELLRIFPDLKLVHVYRDFRDVAASYRTHRWGGGDMAAIAKRIRSIVDRWLAIRGALPSGTYLEVALEQAVDAPLALYGQLLAFTGMEPSSSMETAMRELSSQTLHAGRWKQDLSAAERRDVQIHLRTALDAFGYD